MQFLISKDSSTSLRIVKLIIQEQKRGRGDKRGGGGEGTREEERRRGIKEERGGRQEKTGYVID